MKKTVVKINWGNESITLQKQKEGYFSYIFKFDTKPNLCLLLSSQIVNSSEKYRCCQGECEIINKYKLYCFILVFRLRMRFQQSFPYALILFIKSGQLLLRYAPTNIHRRIPFFHSIVICKCKSINTTLWLFFCPSQILSQILCRGMGSP